MTELSAKVNKSIERLKAFEPPEGYYLAFSGGKDSVVCKALMEMAGIKYDAHYRVTSVDPPELVQFVRDKHPDVARDIPRYDTQRGAEWEGKPITMWNLIPWKLMPPTRRVRYCCQLLKESGGDGRMTVTGVRWAESPRRAKMQGLVTVMDRKAARKLGDHPDFARSPQGGMILTNDNDDSRRMIEQCYTRSKTTLNPIIEWTDAEVWEFIHAHGIPYCSLYDDGWRRLGCVGCPMAGKHGREAEFHRWPKYKGAYMRAFGKMLDMRRAKGRPTTAWQTPEDVFNWWMDHDILPGQLKFDDLEGFDA